MSVETSNPVFTRSCRNCAFCVPQIYDGQEVSTARCIHISFVKDGLGKFVGNQMDIINRDREERIGTEALYEALNEGYRYHDLIDIKNSPRICEHWTSPRALAAEALDFYDDSIENYTDMCPPIVSWGRDNFPMTDIQVYEPLFKNHASLPSEIPVPPKEIQDQSHYCQTCTHFTWDIAEGGAVRPFRGFCHKNAAREAGVFDLLDADASGVKYTYSFLGCDSFKINPRFDKSEINDLPPRLKIFVETNPPEFLRFADFLEFVFFPRVLSEISVSEELLIELKNADLVKLLQARQAEVDYPQFFADLQLTPVGDYFGKRLRMSSAEKKHFWAKFDRYKGATEALLSQIPRVVEDSRPVNDHASAAAMAGIETSNIKPSFSTEAEEEDAEDLALQQSLLDGLDTTLIP